MLGVCIWGSYCVDLLLIWNSRAKFEVVSHISRAGFVLAHFHLISLRLVLIFCCIFYEGRCYLIRLLHQGLANVSFGLYH